MKQAQIEGPTQLTVLERPVPRLQGPDEILVQTAACGIGSGDLMPWFLEKKVGCVLGHEVAGWAAEVGENVKHIRPGDLVFVHHHAPCLTCGECQRGAHVHCQTWQKSHLDPGGMAEWFRVPGLNVYHDSFAVNDLSVDQAVFIEPLGCCLKSLHRLALGHDGDAFTLEHLSSGAVVGCGVMGLLNLAAARALGVGWLAAVEPDPVRRSLAQSHGADLALSPAEAADQLVDSVDFVVIGPGHPEVIRQSLAYLKPRGTALLFAPTPMGITTNLDFCDLYFREISLVPSYSCGPGDIRFAYALLRHGLVRPEGLVTQRFPVHEAQLAWDTARQGGAVLKVLVTFAKEFSHGKTGQQL